jgi:glutamine synthetase adenylyltransferase
MKLGRGGIREIEFFTQTRQLIAGGRDPDLRVRGTVEGLARLARPRAGSRRRSPRSLPATTAPTARSSTGCR